MTWIDINTLRFRLDGEILEGVVAISLPGTGVTIAHTADGESHLGLLEVTSEPEPSKDTEHG